MADNQVFDLNDIQESQDALLAHYTAGSINRYVFPKGTVLFKKGEARQCAFLIEKGTVHIIGNDESSTDKPDNDTDRVLCHLGEGEIFGEMALVDSAPRSATAITHDECHIFVIPRETLRERLGGMDPVVSLLVSLLIERYRSTRVHLPESIKQDKSGSFIDKMSRYDSLPNELFELRDTAAQMENALKEMQIQQDIRRGIHKKEFIPYFQPILKLPEEKLVGFETLIRWQHPEKGLIFPMDFIPVAERSGIVHHLDSNVLEQACKALPEFINLSGDNSFFISVNLSGVTLETDGMVKRIATTLNDNNVQSKNVKLEITESALIHEPEKAELILQELKSLGFNTALDDFGTGYSSLNYLHKFSINYLKIDRSFVSQIHNDQKTLDIIRAIVGLARNFDLGVIAEGIEKKEDVLVLNSVGCDMGQGYYYSKPISQHDAIEYIKEQA